ncbi:MAG: hypothetical protein HY862_07450 [Chloroflexi bacterium]|nr:hypothetical protein [Chloroflexota bacterium]
MPLRAKHRSRFLIVFLLLSAALVLGACRRGGSKGDEAPTSVRFPSITPGGTSTQTIQTPSPFPSPGQTGPTPTKFAGFPSGGGVATIPSNLPNNIQITSPVFGQQIQGFVTVFGSASHPDFIQYAVEFGPDPNPGGLYYPITPQAVTVPVFNSALGGWNTSSLPDGQYQIRLHVWLKGGREVNNVIVGGLQVRNRLPTNTPPRINNNPVISPIAPLTLRPGISATVALGIYDPDNDATSFFATTDNVNVATVSPVGQAITIQAKAAGIATVTVRVTDVRGGSTQTSFLVTVQQTTTTNNPPIIAPIPNQIMTQGTVITVPVTISDPDGDPVTFTTTSALPSILSATNGTGQTVILSALNAGTTSVTLNASDGRGGTYLSVFSVVINPKLTTNNPPAIAAIPSQSLNIGENRDLTLNIGDPDVGDVLTTNVSSNNAAVTATKNSNTSIRITGVSAGSAQVTVTVSDGKGGSASAVFGVTVNAPPPQNRPPVIAAIAAQTIKVGDNITVNLNISDPDGDKLTYSATSTDAAIAGASAGENNTIRVNGVAVGKANVTVSVGDGRGGSTSTSFAVQVDPATVANKPPTIAAIADMSLTAGQSQSVDFVASDPDGDALNINVASDNAGVATAIREDGQNRINVAGVAGGTANITVSVDDGKGGTASDTFVVTVTAPNQAPVIAAVGPQNCLPGQSLTVDLTVSDADNDTVTIASTSDNSGVATVNASSEPLTIGCVTQGTATISVSGSDGRGGTANISFGVTVGAPPNQNPTINGVGGQTCNIGDTLNIPVSYNDPDGNTITVTAGSDNAGVATVNATGEPLTVNCVSAGSANITVNVDDGNGGTASTSFGITVNPPANQNPTLNAISGQTCTVGDTLSVTLSYSDPDGNSINVASSSDNSGVATVNGSGEPLSIFCASAGSANITVNIDDGNGGTASTSFGVTVNAPANQNPTLNAISGQTCTVGDTLSVTLSYSDPDGNSINVASSSDNPGVATVNGSGEPLSIYCASAGSANITVNIDDGNGGTASTSFGVTVNAPANQNPTLNPIGGQTCNEGDTLSVAISYSDPENNPISVSSFSDNPGVADVNASGEPLSVTCSTAGNANITVNIDDGNGGTASTSFGVTVNAIAPTFDVTQYPELPDIGALQGIGQVYNNGQGQGKRNNVFSVAGDDSVNGPNFLNDVATIQYGNYGYLQATVDFYNVQAAHDTTGDTTTSYYVQSAASGDGWTIDRLFDSTYANSAICAPGQTPLDCELALSRPAVLFISFNPSNATQTAPAQFEALLQQAVNTALANGTIPVLATLPNDGFVDAGTLAQYNEIIVTIATDNNVPLWNVYITMQNASNGVYSVGGSGAMDFNDGSLSSGVNRRNLAALQILDSIRQALFP